MAPSGGMEIGGKGSLPVSSEETRHQYWRIRDVALYPSKARRTEVLLLVKPAALRRILWHVLPCEGFILQP
jgi:hypothetical protein